MSALQMEYQEEVQTLDYDVCISTKVPSNNQDMSVVDTSINLDSYNSTSSDNNDTSNGNDSQICNKNSGIIDVSVINLEVRNDDLQIGFKNRVKVMYQTNCFIRMLL